MNYYYSKNIKEDSYIALGDMSGSVKIMSFSPVERGPFKQEPKRDTLFIRYESVLKVYIHIIVYFYLILYSECIIVS